MKSPVKSVAKRLAVLCGRYGTEREAFEELERAKGSDVTFVQIGAHDGKTDDELYPFVKRLGWKGILVEPVPYLFDRLKETYDEAEGIHLVNAALSNCVGKVPFYYVRDDAAVGLPRWYDQLGSFHLDIILRHVADVPELKDRIITTEVEATTFSDLLARFGIGQVDLVSIDAEGHDDKILKSVDFNKYRPDVVIYEGKHLGLRALLGSLIFMARHRYRAFYDNQNNIVCRSRRPAGG